MCSRFGLASLLELFRFWSTRMCILVPPFRVMSEALSMRSWLPLDPLLHCLNKTENKLIFLDSERAARLVSSVPALKRAGTASVVVLDAKVSKWEGVTTWQEFVSLHQGDPTRVLHSNLQLGPEDCASIFFTSGTYVDHYFWSSPSLMHIYPVVQVCLRASSALTVNS